MVIYIDNQLQQLIKLTIEKHKKLNKCTNLLIYTLHKEHLNFIIDNILQIS